MCQFRDPFMMVSWSLSTVCAFYSSFAIFISVPRNGMKLTFWRNILGPRVFGTDQPASSSSNHRSRHNSARSSKTVHGVQEHEIKSVSISFSLTVIFFTTEEQLLFLTLAIPFTLFLVFFTLPGWLHLCHE